MLKNLFWLAVLALSVGAMAQDPWPMSRHDRWGSGTATVGPDPSTLTTPWVVADLDSAYPVVSGPCIGADGFGYFGDWVANNLYKLDIGTNSILSAFQALNFVGGTPALDGTQVIFTTTSPSGHLFAVDTASMDYNWFADEPYTGGAPKIGPDGSVVAGFSNGVITRFNATTGAPIWSRSGFGAADGELAFSRDDSLVFFPNGNHMTALNWADGSTAWDINYGTTLTEVAVAPNGTVVFGDDNGTIHAVSPTNGASIWSFTALSPFEAGAAFSPDGTACYIAGEDYRLYSFNTVTGARNWSFTSSDAVAHSPIVGTDGSIYFQNINCDLYRISPSGTQVWTEHLPGQERGPLTIGPDATLYVPCNGLVIVRQQAISEPITSLSMFRGELLSGNAGSLAAIDGNYVVMQPGITLAPTEPPIQPQMTATLPYTAPASFTIALNSSVNTPGILQSVEVLNNTTGNWDVVDSRPAATVDTSIAVRVTNATAYWNSSTQAIQFRVTFSVVAPTRFWPWTARMDYAALTNVVPSFQG